MNPESLKNDIPLSTAIAAHNGTSWTPEKRGEQAVNDYVSTLASDYERLQKGAKTELKQQILDAEFETYRQGYRSRFMAYLHSHARCMSSMIAGPSNYPVRRQQKRNDIADKRLTELCEYRERALSAIHKKMHPELAPIMAGDSDAVERLAEKIKKAEDLQARMKACNAAIRKHAKAGAEKQVAALMELGLGEKHAHSLLQPDFCGRIGFADYELTNNNANIRRMKERLAQIAKAKTAQPLTVENNESGITFEDCPADNRVRLFFPGKPDAQIRDALKSNGFRWAPSLNCWQAYRNDRAISHAKKVAGVAS